MVSSIQMLAKRTGEEFFGESAPIVQDHGNTRAVGGAKCRSGEKVPRPARVRHDMHERRLSHHTPQIPEVGGQPKKCSQTGYSTNGARLVGSIRLHDTHPRPLLRQQSSELLGLVRHPTRRRWKWPDQDDAGRREIEHLSVRRASNRPTHTHSPTPTTSAHARRNDAPRVSSALSARGRSATVGVFAPGRGRHPL